MSPAKHPARSKVKLEPATKARRPQPSVKDPGPPAITPTVKPAVRANKGLMPSISAPEALSFLKETKGEVSWTSRELATALKLRGKEPEQVLALLQMQGYVKPAANSNEWLTTPEGEAVAGAKSPRFTRESVEKAIGALKQRIEEMNRDRGAEFTVDTAVAFGDFLSERPQVQAAEVGVELTRRKRSRDTQRADVPAPDSFVEQKLERAVLRKLRARTALLNLRAYQPWMSHRSHRKLL